MSILVAAIVAAAATLWLMRPGPPLVARFALQLSEGQQLAGAIAISPDGRNIVYAARPSSGGTSRLYVRPMDQLQATALQGTEGAQKPFFSPDGEWVGFFVPGELKKVSLSGGAPLALCEVRGRPTASWGTSSIVFSSRNGLFRVSSGGGTPEPIATDDSDGWVLFPEILPNGRAVLYTTWPNSNIAVASLDTGERQILTAGTAARYLPTGHIVFTRGSSILAAPFDLERLEMVSSPVPVLDVDVIALSQFQVSVGALVYVEGSELTRDAKLVLVDREGVEQTFVNALRYFQAPRLSPDGERLAVNIIAETTDIWIIERVRGTLTRLTFGEAEGRPVWSPEGNRVLFASGRAGERKVFSRSADGSGDATQLTTGTYRVPTSISSDGKTLVFRQNSEETGLDIGTVRLDADRDAEPQMLLQTPFNEHSGMLSPDDRWLAYVSDDSGQEEVYVTPFPGPGGHQLISTDGGSEPVWSRDGQELYYRNGEALMAVSIKTEPAFNAGQPTLLFEGPYRLGVDPGGNPGSNYDVTPDGRFLMIRGDESSGATQIHVVLNWVEELERLVPTED